MGEGIGFVLIPGGGMSDWLWARLLPRLSTPSISIGRRLRENTRESRLGASFDDCLDYAAEETRSSPFSSYVLVAHSGSGILAGALAMRLAPQVAHLVFIAANIPPSGMKALDSLPPELRERNARALRAQAARDSIPMREMEGIFRSAFCNTCFEEDISFVLEQDFLPEPLCALEARADWLSFPAIGRTYIVLERDRTLSVEAQEGMAANLGIGDIRRIDSGHLAPISHPEELARILEGVAAEAASPR
jgi:pimeloyl-ACP methyl ester carboxylesterase